MIDGRLSRAIKDEVVSIPKNIAHEFWNDGTENAVYIQEFFPALKIDQLLETFFALARDGKLNRKGKPNVFQASVIMLHFQNELRLAKPDWLIQKVLFKLLSPFGKLLGYLPKYELQSGMIRL